MEHPGRSELRILCVDDNHDDILIMELALALDPAVDIHLATDTDKALSLLSTRGPYDGVLLTESLATSSDDSLLKRIVRPDGSPPTPVILLVSEPFDVATLQRPGIAGYIQKPFDPLRLAKDVRRLLTHLGASSQKAD